MEKKLFNVVNVMTFNFVDCKISYKRAQGEFMVAPLLKSLCIPYGVTVPNLVVWSAYHDQNHKAPDY